MLATPETARMVRVFVSSPSDVAEERAVLDEVVASINRTDGEAAGFRLELIKWETHVTPQIGPRPQQVIDAQIPEYDVYIGILKHRFGTPTGRYRSGTEKEYRDALQRWKAEGSPWILFYFATAVIDPVKLDLDQFARVQRFRQAIETKGQGLYSVYEGVRDGPRSFYVQVSEHLRGIVRQMVPSPKVRKRGKPPANSEKYLRDLLDKTGFIDIRGLVESEGRAKRFPIEDLFISLSTSLPPESRDRGRKRSQRERDRRADCDLAGAAELRSMPLDRALQFDRLVVVGDPGSGKTTFLRRVAHVLCRSELGIEPDATKQQLGIDDRTFPVLLRVSDLTQHFAAFAGRPSAPQGADTPAWLLHFLRAASKANHWNLDAEYFHSLLQEGRCTVLLDGLDEAPDTATRERVTRWIENVAKTFGTCRWVVTTRPSSYAGPDQLPGFAHARIDPLSDEAVRTFLSHWCGKLYADSPASADEHCRELLAALAARPDIRRMARNPVMLTALAVVHWNEHRLPEQRADLYESIIRWLSRSRPRGAERQKSRRAVDLLQELGLRMQSHPDGMQTKVPQRWAAEQLAVEWAGANQPVTKDHLAAAIEFLDAEELDSGIVVSRGRDVQFWHRTFQEFLAARAIAARPDAEQESILWGQPARFDQPEWREVLLLLGGILHEHGRAKVDQLFRRAIERLGPAAQLADQARCVGLLGAIARDLTPVDYQPPDQQYQSLLDAVQAIFDPAALAPGPRGHPHRRRRRLGPGRRSSNRLSRRGLLCHDPRRTLRHGRPKQQQVAPQLRLGGVRSGVSTP
jgi:hypothetical protein